MNITRTTAGLEMTANYNNIREIRKMLARPNVTMISQESEFIANFLVNYEQVAPEDVGALTSAPIISDGENIYGYMDYQIKNFLEELTAGKTIFWQKG
jgi:hypothetical protein